MAYSLCWFVRFTIVVLEVLLIGCGGSCLLFFICWCLIFACGVMVCIMCI